MWAFSEEVILKIFLAFIVGGLIGFEREKHGREAGFRTHILVTIGSTLIMMVSLYVSQYYQGDAQLSLIRADPGRIASMAITGIGFLGAGVIIQSGNVVRGLTTAASLWLVCAMGLCIGCGFYFPVAVSLILALFSLSVLYFFEDKIKKVHYSTITIQGKDKKGQLEEIDACFKSLNLKANFKYLEKVINQKIVTYKISVKYKDYSLYAKASEKLTEIPEITKIIWE
jgi:putative Mg2+ transporter-C (MgtC) family protein